MSSVGATRKVNSGAQLSFMGTGIGGSLHISQSRKGKGDGLSMAVSVNRYSLILSLYRPLIFSCDVAIDFSLPPHRK